MVSSKTLDMEINEARENLEKTLDNTEYKDMDDVDVMELDSDDFNIGFDLGWVKALEFVKGKNNHYKLRDLKNKGFMEEHEFESKREILNFLLDDFINFRLSEHNIEDLSLDYMLNELNLEIVKND